MYILTGYVTDRNPDTTRYNTRSIGRRHIAPLNLIKKKDLLPTSVVNDSESGGAKPRQAKRRNKRVRDDDDSAADALPAKAERQAKKQKTYLPINDKTEDGPVAKSIKRTKKRKHRVAANEPEPDRKSTKRRK